MNAREVLAEHLPEVLDFVEKIESTADDGDRKAELRRVSKLVRMMNAFYETYLPEYLDVHVRGFSYKDKRKVSRRLVRVEADAPNGDSSPPLELAAQFEELSDLLHGALDFGYSDEDDDFVTFHRDAFPDWLATAEEWLRASGVDDVQLAERVDQAWRRYTNVIGAAY
jgi:hypothetical protein